MHALIHPTCFDLLQDIEILLYEMYFCIQHASEVAQLFQFVLLNSIHPGTDVFSALFTVYIVRLEPPNY